MVVVLPAPLGPITPRHSPGAISNERSSTTVVVAVALAKVAGLEEGRRHGGIVAHALAGPAQSARPLNSAFIQSMKARVRAGSSRACG